MEEAREELQIAEVLLEVSERYDILIHTSNLGVDWDFWQTRELFPVFVSSDRVLKAAFSRRVLALSAPIQTALRRRLSLSSVFFRPLFDMEGGGWG